MKRTALQYSGTAGAAARYTEVMSSQLKTTVSILVLGVIFGGGYLAFRTYQSSSGVLDRYMHAQQKAPPTQCLFPGGGSFQVTVQDLIIYMDGQNMRADWTQFEAGRSMKIHAISNDNGMHYYAWGDEETNPMLVPKEQFVEIGGTSSEKEKECGPWWSPDASMFVVPDNLTFVPQ